MKARPLLCNLLIVTAIVFASTLATLLVSGDPWHTSPRLATRYHARQRTSQFFEQAGREAVGRTKTGGKSSVRDVSSSTGRTVQTGFRQPADRPAAAPPTHR